MSADNWAHCPRCTAAKERERQELVERTRLAYGRVSPEKYLEMFRESQKPIDIGETLREDYELGILNGRFYVIYTARCDNCGFTFSFKEDKPIGP